MKVTSFAIRAYPEHPGCHWLELPLETLGREIGTPIERFSIKSLSPGQTTSKQRHNTYREIAIPLYGRVHISGIDRKTDYSSGELDFEVSDNSNPRKMLVIESYENVRITNTGTRIAHLLCMSGQETPMWTQTNRITLDDLFAVLEREPRYLNVLTMLPGVCTTFLCHADSHSALKSAHGKMSVYLTERFASFGRMIFLEDGALKDTPAIKIDPDARCTAQNTGEDTALLLLFSTKSSHDSS
jgi:hypothetical protein